MPIYAFRCQACQHAFDRLQKLSDPVPGACPACGADAVQKQVTAPSFRLAGSGWYETDFKGTGEKRHNLAGSGDGDKPAASDGAGKDKPAKAEAKPAKPAGKPAAGASGTAA